MKILYCCHEYQSRPPYSLKSQTKCTIAQLFEKWKEAVPFLAAGGYQDESVFSLNEVLPLDGEGKCIFHSRKLEWKVKNSFTSRMKQLLYILLYLDAQVEEDHTVDLREITFLGAEDAFYDEELILLEAFQTKHLRLHFSGSFFLSKVKIQSCEWHFIDFSGAVFEEEIEIQDCRLGSMNFDSCDFRGAFTIEESQFSDFVDFAYCNFNNHIYFHNITFEKQATFTHSKFSAKSPSTISFCYFTEFLDFAYCIFDTYFIVDGCVFLQEVNFTATVFKTRVFFKSLQIHSSFIIKKESAGEPVFQDLVEFQIDEENLLGQIIFEEVSFLNIKQQDKNSLLDLSRKNKVVIGKGCIKYRLQTPDKTLVLDNDKQNLIIELVQSFSSFFIKHEGLNLGFEIKERNQQKVVFFYFSDENLEPDIFIQRLANAEQAFLGLMVLSPNEIRVLRKQGMALQKKENALLNAIDGMTALFSTFVRVGVRITLGKWKSTDTDSLLNALSFSGQEVVSGAELNELLLRNYSYDNLLKNKFQFFINSQNVSIGSSQVTLEEPNFYGANPQVADTIINQSSGFEPRAYPDTIEKIVEKSELSPTKKNALLSNLGALWAPTATREQKLKVGVLLKELYGTLSSVDQKLVEAYLGENMKWVLQM